MGTIMRIVPAAELDRLSSAEGSLVLFDGVCGLCNRWVDFVLRRDRKGVFKFAPLQSMTGQAILLRHGVPTDDLTTIVLLRGARIDCYSTATLEISDASAACGRCSTSSSSCRPQSGIWSTSSWPSGASAGSDNSMPVRCLRRKSGRDSSSEAKALLCATPCG